MSFIQKKLHVSFAKREQTCKTDMQIHISIGKSVIVLIIFCEYRATVDNLDNEFEKMINNTSNSWPV